MEFFPLKQTIFGQMMGACHCSDSPKFRSPICPEKGPIFFESPLSRKQIPIPPKSMFVWKYTLPAVSVSFPAVFEPWIPSFFNDPSWHFSSSVSATVPGCFSPTHLCFCATFCPTKHGCFRPNQWFTETYNTNIIFWWLGCLTAGSVYFQRNRTLEQWAPAFGITGCPWNGLLVRRDIIPTDRASEFLAFKTMGSPQTMHVHKVTANNLLCSWANLETNTDTVYKI